MRIFKKNPGQGDTQWKLIEEEKKMEGTIQIISKATLTDHIAGVLKEKIDGAINDVIGKFNDKINNIMDENMTTVEKVEIEVPIVPLSVRLTVSDRLIEAFKQAGYQASMPSKIKSADPREEIVATDFDTIIVKLM